MLQVAVLAHGNASAGGRCLVTDLQPVLELLVRRAHVMVDGAVYVRALLGEVALFVALHLVDRSRLPRLVALADLALAWSTGAVPRHVVAAR